MTWPTSVIIEVIFIPLYVVLLVLNLRNVLTHGYARTSGFISLLLFSTVHLVGNIILVVSYKQGYSSITLTVWGYILQSIGLSFLVSASLAFYGRARASLESGEDTKGTSRLIKGLNLINMAALICIIVGYTNTNFTNAQGQIIPKPQLPVETKIGGVLYILLLVLILVLTLLNLRHVVGHSKLLRNALLVTLPLMIVRAAFALYTIVEASIFRNNVWAKFVLQYLSEFAALALLTGVGFWLPRTMREGNADAESLGQESPIKDGQYWDGQHTQQQLGQAPISYPPPPPQVARS